MDRESISKFTKIVVIVLGGICTLAAVATLPSSAFTWGYLFITAFGILVAPRMSLTLPRSKFAISFSDALVFLTLLLYGGQAAIVFAVIETAANCLFLRSRGFPFGKLMIPTNVSLNAISTGITIFIWMQFQLSSFGPLDISKTQHLISALGLLAVIQFLGSSVLAAAFQSLKDGSSLWETWRRDCFTSSMTQIVGAGLAGILYK